MHTCAGDVLVRKLQVAQFSVEIGHIGQLFSLLGRSPRV